MNYGKALPIAEKFKDAISPYCDRVEIAGSVRRHRADVGDIEIVCIPKFETYEVSDGLFTKLKTTYNRGFIKIVDSMNILKGDAENGKYMMRYSGRAEIKFDIFVACKENWGYQFAIRTGSAKFSHLVLALGWSKKGFRGHEGFLYSRDDYEKIDGKLVLMKDAKIVPLYEEIDLFNLIGMDFVEPENRNL